MIGLRIVETGEQMNGTGTRGCEAHTEPARELGVPAGHEGRRFLVPGLQEADLAAGAIERTHDTVDAVAGITVDAIDAPVAQALHEEVADGRGHRVRRAKPQRR